MREEDRDRMDGVTREDARLESVAQSEADSGGRSDSSAPSAAKSRSVEEIRNGVISMIKTVYDPEIPVDVYELGLIYSLEVDQEGAVSIDMTLTTPMCPVAEILPPEVEAKVRAVEGVTAVDLRLVWEPPWTVERMSEAARLELNL